MKICTARVREQDFWLHVAPILGDSKGMKGAASQDVLFFATRDASHAGCGNGAAGGRTTLQGKRADPGLGQAWVSPVLG